MSWLCNDRYKKVILLTLVFFGLLLRLWGIKQDLPYNYYGDESDLIYYSLKFGTGDLNPHWFVWPTLFPYFLFFSFCIFYVVGMVSGWFNNTTDFLYLYFQDPSTFFLIGRITAAILGTTSIFLVYSLAKKTYNENTGLISAAIFTFLPLPVEYSHYAVVDTPLVFMILLSFIFIINIFLYGRLKDYLFSGFFSGLAMGTKYIPIFLVLPIFLAHFFAHHKKKLFGVVFNKKIILCFLFMFLGFFLACPFAIVDFPKFISDIKGQILCAKIGTFGWEKVNPYVYHLTYNLSNALGLPLLIIAAISLLYLTVRRKKIDLILFIFPTVYFLLFAGLDKNPYARFMLPVIPFLTIFSGSFLSGLKDAFSKRYRKTNAYFSIFLVLLLLIPIFKTIKKDLIFSLPDTATLAKEWIEKNIPVGSKILLSPAGPPLVQSPTRIRLEAEQKPKEQLRYGYHKKRTFFYQVKEKAAAQRINYELTYLSQPIGYLEGEYGYEKIMSETQRAIKDYKEQYDFAIISDALLYKLLEYPKESVPKKYWSLRNFYENIFNNYQPIKTFLAQDNVSKGPTIRIYKLR